MPKGCLRWWPGTSVACVCWHCGKHKTVMQLKEATIVKDVMDLARQVDMLVEFDELNNRLLLFCDTVCRDRNKGNHEFSVMQPQGDRTKVVMSVVYLLEPPSSVYSPVKGYPRGNGRTSPSNASPER